MKGQGNSWFLATKFPNSSYPPVIWTLISTRRQQMQEQGNYWIFANLPSSLISAIDSCDLRIRTLFTTLRKMHQADSPTSTRKEGPAFLRHIATLLTRGTSSDKEVGRVIAVTATIEESSESISDPEFTNCPSECFWTLQAGYHYCWKESPDIGNIQ